MILREHKMTITFEMAGDYQISKIQKKVALPSPKESAKKVDKK